jgi:hypothetical protein
MRAEPIFAGAPFRVLLDFESPSDLAFISIIPNIPIDKDHPVYQLDREVAHTGLVSLQLPAGSDPFEVKLGALLPPGDFPGVWNLAGGFFISREAATVEVSYVVGFKTLLTRKVSLEPRKWTAVMLDLSSLADPNAAPPAKVGTLRFRNSGGTVWCDDVVLFDNTAQLVGDPEKAGDNWSVRRRGFATLMEKPGSYKLRIPTPEAGADGWKVDEADDMRVCLSSADGRRFWTIYGDGRGYLDGKFKSAVELPPDQQALFEEQQASPAEMTVPEELGRVERNAPGDRNHDGYAEMTGAYQLKASGARFAVTLTPHTARLVRPVLEIAGLPPGKPVASIEGKLLEKVVRLPEGHVLVELPGTIERAVTMNLRVQ